MSSEFGFRALARVMRGGVAAAALLGVGFGALPAAAQGTPAGAPPSDSAMVNLLRLLVDQGVLKADKAQALMAQAEAEAAQARAAAPAADLAALPPAAAGTVRVPYVPETVRAQIRDELRRDVLAQARSEQWASPEEAAPRWVKNLRVFGDMRFRSMSTFYGDTNSDQIIDAGAWNPTGPYDLQLGVLPILNATNDRINTAQYRLRLGIEAKVANYFTAGVQIASGDNNGPTSTNAAFAGSFGKRDLWLQNAYLRGNLDETNWAMVGRFDNPLRTTDLMFDPDLAFDGVFAQADAGRLLLDKSWTLAVRGGALPIDFGNDNFPVLDVNKRNFRDRYLYTAQFEAGKRFDNGIDLRASVGYHNFTYLRGHVSDPCDIYANPLIECSTDNLRSVFMTKGNTWMFLRQFDRTNQGDAPEREPQYIGHKFAYRVIDLNAWLSVPVSGGVRAQFTANYLNNRGFDRQNICSEGVAGQPQNNIANAGTSLAGPCQPDGPGRFVGGNEGYAGYFSIGHPELFRVNPGRAHKGQWAINAAYKYLESDAVPDAFTDSDFHLGGTNAKGYFIGGAYALFDGVAIGGRWLSANEVSGDPLAIDVLHLDLLAAF
jgi:hypothetical protein